MPHDETVLQKVTWNRVGMGKSKYEWCLRRMSFAAKPEEHTSSTGWRSFGSSFSPLPKISEISFMLLSCPRRKSGYELFACVWPTNQAWLWVGKGGCHFVGFALVSSLLQLSLLDNAISHPFVWKINALAKVCQKLMRMSETKSDLYFYHD